MLYEYRAEFLKAVDGDTVDLNVDLGFDVRLKMRVRLAGVNTPELHSKDMAEREKAQEAKKFVESWCVGRALLVKTEKDRREKFGRYLATLFLQDGSNPASLNDEMVKYGVAKPYDGGRRDA